MDAFRDARILIVDDDEDNVAVLEQMLRKAGYTTLHSTTDSRQAVAMVSSLAPDLLILDLIMPPPDGFAILDELRLSPQHNQRMPILVLTGDVAACAKVKAVSMGAHEFLSKPVDKVDLLIRLRNLLDGRFAHRLAKEEKARRLAAERSSSALEVERVLIDRFAALATCLDPERAGSARRVAALACRIGAELKLEETLLRRLERATPLFDLGMLAVPERIRKSTAVLTADERQAMKSHTIAAREMLCGTGLPALEMAKEIALLHHERWDGTGYPLGMQAADIPLAARIVAVAHVYDALVTERPYRRARSAEEAREEVMRQAGFAFDPDVVAALLRALSGAAPKPAEELEIGV